MSACRLRGVLALLLDLVAPPACVACRRGGDLAPRDALCRDCRIALPWLGTDLCRRCGLPAPCGGARGRGRCPARTQAFAAAWAPVAYGGPAAALVVALKERGALRVARVMAAQMAALAPPACWAGEGAALVPVPGDPL